LINQRKATFVIFFRIKIAGTILAVTAKL